jgi:hypothetical protein
LSQCRGFVVHLATDFRQRDIRDVQLEEAFLNMLAKVAERRAIQIVAETMIDLGV